MQFIQKHKQKLFIGYSIYIFFSLLVGILTLNIDSMIQTGNKLIEEIEKRQMMQDNNYECMKNSDCNHGTCVLETDAFGNSLNQTFCECDNKYIDYDGKFCEYKQRSGLVALLLSIFLGLLAIDRFYLTRGVCCCYGCVATIKLLTGGGLGIWYIIDIILIAVGSLSDGNGQPLSDDF